MAPMRWQAILSTFHRNPFPPTACFHPKMRFSPISNRNQALVQPKRYYDHWKVFQGDLWWPQSGGKPFPPLLHPLSTHAPAWFPPKVYISKPFPLLSTQSPAWFQSKNYQLLQKGIKLWFRPKGIMTIENCSRVIYGGHNLVASHFHPFPPTSQPGFHPKVTFPATSKRNQALVQPKGY